MFRQSRKFESPFVGWRTEKWAAMKQGFAYSTRPKKQSNRSQDLVIPKQSEESAACRQRQFCSQESRFSPANAVSIDKGKIGPAGVVFCDEGIQPAEHSLPAFAVGFGLF